MSGKIHRQDASSIFPSSTEYRCNLVPCGHVLGSRSLLVSRGDSSHQETARGAARDGIEFFYTGDFFTQPDRILSALAPVHTEILACECTYGTPFFEFPPYEVLAREITDWIATSLNKGPIVLYGYPLGKNQELLALLNPFSVDTPIIADEDTCACVDVYRDAGIPLPPCEPYRAYNRGKFFEKEHRWILLLPLNSRFDERYQKLDRTGCRRAAFSGWTLDAAWLEEWHVDAGFPLSDHPSFSNLVSFIEDCAPATLLLMHGNGTLLRHRLLDKMVGPLRNAVPRDTRIIALKP
ncbi:MAG: hypothetical protein GYA24_15130 [Candidatus Lokiarchaeota archaeon]|nr:hypothetical protein [Candidatus Lokiarchaeota archaeon]